MELTDFWHGQISLTDTLKIMDKNPPGSFLVRKEISGQLILTFRSSPTKIKHFQLPTIKSPFLEDRPHLHSVKALVNHIVNSLKGPQYFIPPESSDPIPEPSIPLYLPNKSHNGFPQGFCIVCEETIPGSTKLLSKHYRSHRIAECETCETVMSHHMWEVHKAGRRGRECIKPDKCLLIKPTKSYTRSKMTKASKRKKKESDLFVAMEVEEEPEREKALMYKNNFVDKQLLSTKEGPTFDHEYGYGRLNIDLIEKARDNAAPVNIVIPDLLQTKFRPPAQEANITAGDEINEDSIGSVGCISKVQKRNTIFNEDLLLHILYLSQEPQYQDVTIICENGVFESNSFVLASIFPLFKDLLKSADHDEPFVISMPDMDKEWLQQLFHALANKHEEIYVPAILSSHLSTFMQEKLKDRKQRNENNESYTVFKRLVGVKSNDVKILVQPKILKKSNDIQPREPKTLKKIDVKTSEPKTKVRKMSKTGTTKPQKFNPQGLFKLHGSVGEVDELTGKFAQDVPFEVVDYSSVDLNNHEKIFNLNKCIFCLNEFNTWEELSIHEMSHPRGTTKFSCLICNHQCIRPILKNHYLRKHLRPDDYVRCPRCKNLQLKILLERHLAEICNGLKPSILKPRTKTADMEFVLCTECGESVKNIKYHMQYHHSELKEWPCKTCGKIFDKRTRLLTHLKRGHNSKQPCPECGVMVKKMRLHMMSAHVPDSEKKHQCQDCGKGALIKHRMNMHLKTRPYQCRYGCSNAYNDTSNRNAHEKKTHGQLFTSVKDQEFF